MASINYTQSLNNTDFYSNDFQSSSVSTWNEPESLNLIPESFADFETSLFFEDSENDNTLLQASKKISKSSNGSYKKSKRARNPWTPREDAKLMELMKKYGQSWAMISSQLEGRTGKQVRDRYLNKLRPNIKCGDWSAEEDNLLVKLLKEVGNRWSLIATHLPTRTEGQVKNRYYSYIKKRLQPDGTLCLTANDNNKANSEDITSHTTSPRIEENNFDFTNEFDMNLMNGPTMNFQPEPIYNTNFNSFTNGNFAITKGPYGTEEEIYSEGSTTQGSNSQSGSNSPLRVNLVDPTDVISYDVAETFFYRQPSVCRPFHVAPIQHDGQVDNMLSKVTSYFVESSNKGSEVDSFFSRDATSSPQGDERLSQLNMRKAYLELALAKTLEEINGF